MLCVERSGSVRQRSASNCWLRPATTLPYSACYRQTRTGRRTTRTQSVLSPTLTPFCCDTRALRQRALVVSRRSAPAVLHRCRQRILCLSLPSQRACWCTSSSSSSSSKLQQQWLAVYRRVRQPSTRLLVAAPTRLAYKRLFSSATFTVSSFFSPAIVCSSAQSVL